MFLVSVFVWFPGRPSVAARDHRQRSCSHLEEQLSSLEVPITPLYSYILIYLYPIIFLYTYILYSYLSIFPQCNVRAVSKFQIQIWSTSKPLYAACKTFGFLQLTFLTKCCAGSGSTWSRTPTLCSTSGRRTSSTPASVSSPRPSWTPAARQTTSLVRFHCQKFERE